MKPKRKTGAVPESRLAVYDGDKNCRGHLTKASTASNASRMSGTRNMVLGKGPDNKPAWLVKPKAKGK